MTATADILDDLPDRISVDCPFREKDKVAAVPGARWNTSLRRWSTPLSWAACLALREEFGADLTIGPELKTWAKEQASLKKSMSALRTAMSLDEVSPDARLTKDWLDGFGLFEYQKVDAIAMATAKSYLLMNETGVGKTRSALAALAITNEIGENPFPALIVAPKSMLRVWRDEIPRFFPEATISVVEGTPTKAAKALTPGSDIYIIGWGSLRKYSRLARYGSEKTDPKDAVDKELQALELQSVIYDECHRAKSPKALCTRAAWAVAANCEYRYGLTGSPIQDTVEDLYGVLHLLFPDDYPTKSAYERYVETEWNMWGGRDVKGIYPHRRKEFYANFDTIARRVTKDMALPFLPPRVYEVRWVTLPPKLRKAYESMKETYIAELSDGGVMTAANQLVRAGMLTRLANAELKFDEEDPEKYEYVSSPKVDQFVDDLLEGDFAGEQIVVFADSIGMLDLLQVKLDAKGFSWVRIDGSVTGVDREEAIKTFQNGDAMICMLTRAGGEGITLTAASTMVRLLRSWSYTVHTQVEARIHRIGSERHASVLYVDYITEDTIEEAMMVRLNAKDGRAKEILRTDEFLAMLK